MTPPSLWIGSIQNRRCAFIDCVLDRIDIAERHLVKTIDRGTESLQMFGFAARRQHRQCAAVKGAREGDHAVTPHRHPEPRDIYALP